MNAKLVVFALLGMCCMASATVYFQESFDGDWESRWTHSDWKKADGTAGEFELSHGEWYGDAEIGKGLRTSKDARFYDISASFDEFSNNGKDLVIQFSVQHGQKIDCGGGYVKVMPAGLNSAEFSGDSKYNIMFGPDICGSSTKRIHVIFENEGENYLINKDIACETDQLTHVYTLIVGADNTYEVRVDGKKRESGSLKDDWDMLEPKMIKDPAESKPSDWVDEATMDDPEETKPEDWDNEPKLIADPDAEKPDDWDDEDDGEWEAPMIDNPEYKGEWYAKKIPNPDYQGSWVHPEIENPDFVDDDELYAYESFGAIGLDIWQVKAGTIFDNIIITDDIAEAEAFMDETFDLDAEREMFNEAETARKAAEAAERAAMEAEDEDDDDDEDYDDIDDEDHDEL